jgi:hypothetical protein
MKLVRFTAPDGAAVLINPDQVASVRAAIAVPGARTAIVVAGASHAVTEPPDVVAARLALQVSANGQGGEK